MLVADFKGFDVPYSAEGNYYYAAGVDLITVMAAAQMKRFKAITNIHQKLVAFDLMTYQDENWKVIRAQELASLERACQLSYG